MQVLSEFRESQQLQEKGSRLELGNAEETVLYVRRANHKWDEVLTDCKRFVSDVYYSEATLSADDRYKATALAIAEYLVCGWENMINEETGEQIPYTLSNAKAVFCNRDMYLSLNMFILGHASNFENYLYKKLEEDKQSAKKP